MRFVGGGVDETTESGDYPKGLLCSKLNELSDELSGGFRGREGSCRVIGVVVKLDSRSSGGCDGTSSS